MKIFVGIDWGSRNHAVCAVDDRGIVLEQFTIVHDWRGLDELVARLRALGGPDEVKVCIETPRHVVVSYLLEAGFTVIPAHPNFVKAARSRYSTTGAKSDPQDAFILADFLRTDLHRLRILEPDSEMTQALRELVCARRNAVDQRHRSIQRLRSCLSQHFPGAIELFSKLHSPIPLAFLERYPTYETAKRIGQKRMTSFLKKQGYPGSKKPEQLIEALKAAPAGTTGVLSAASRVTVNGVIAELRVFNANIKTIGDAMKNLLDEHEDSRIFENLPMTDTTLKADFILLFGDQRNRFNNAESLAALCGVAPVTFASGRSRRVGFRVACRKPQRQTMHLFAHLIRRKCAWSSAVYDRARQRGCSHAHALRILSRAWLRVLFHCWKDKVPFDPERLAAAKNAAI